MMGKLLKKRRLFRGLAFITVVSLVGFLIPPLPAAPERGRIRGGSVVVYPFQPGPTSPEFARRATDALKLALTESGVFTVLSVTKESPTVRRAIEEGRLTEADLDFTVPVDKDRGLKLARVVGADYFVLGEVADYRYNEEVPAVEVALKVRLYDVRTGSLLREVEARGVSGEHLGFRPEKEILEEEAIRDAAKRAVQALIGPPKVPPPPPKPPRVVRKKRVNPWPVLAALGVLFLILNKTKRAKAAVSAPTDVRAVALENGVRLTWSPVSGAAKYVIYRAEVGRYQPPAVRAPRGAKIAEVPATITEYTDYTAQPGVLYTYEVGAVDRAGREGPPARAITPAGTTRIGPRIPSPPLNLRAQAGEGSVQLTWAPSPEEFVESYRVYRSLSAQGPFALVGEVPASQTYFSDTGLVNGQTYFYRVTAVTRVFTGGARYESEPTPVVSATPSNVPPVAPTGLAGRSVYDPETLKVRVELTWNPNPEPDIVGYNIYRSAARGRASEGRPPFSLLNKFSRPGRRTGRSPTRQYQLIAQRWQQTTFVDQTVEPDKVYSYYITAVDRTGQEGPPSEVIEISTNVPPPRVTGLVARAGDMRVELSWNPVVAPDLAGYNVYRSTQPGGGSQGAYVKLNIKPVTATSYLDLNVTNNVTYYYVVTAVDSQGLESLEYSNEVRATPHKPAAKVDLSAQPTELSANGIATSTVTATVTDEQGQPVAGVKVTFSVDTGTISPVTAYTDSTGRATTTFTAPTSREDLTATVTAAAEGVPTPARVVLTLRGSRPAGITVTAEPAQLTADGLSSATITADVVDTAGQPVADGTPVTFTVPQAQPQENAGFIGPDPQTALKEKTTTFTAPTKGGRAVASYVAGIRPGTVVIWAEAEGVKGSVKVTLKVGSPARIEISAEPERIVADGASTSTITATVYDAHDNPVPGVEVRFSATDGTITQSAVTDSAGRAQAILTSSTTPGTVTVVATVEQVSAHVEVEFVPGEPAEIQLTAWEGREPGARPLTRLYVSLPSDQRKLPDTAEIKARVLDASGNPIPGAVVTFSADGGTITSSARADENGIAWATFSSGPRAGVATITAKADNITATLQLELLPGDPATIRLYAEQTSAPADGETTIRIRAAVRDANGNPVADGTLIKFQTDLGTFVGGTETITVATKDGEAVAVLKAPSKTGQAHVTAKWVQTYQEDPAEVEAQPIVITFGEVHPAKIRLEVAQTTLSASRRATGESLSPTLSNTTTVVATVLDAQGRPIVNPPNDIRVRFVCSDASAKFLDPETGLEVDAQGVLIDKSTGTAEVVFRTGWRAGTVTISAISDTATASASVTVLPGPPAEVRLSVTPPEIWGNGIATASVSAEVFDQNGNRVADGTPVVFSTSLGEVSPATASTSSGVALSTLVSAAVEEDTPDVKVKARAGDVEAETTVTFKAVIGEQMQVSAEPPVIPGNGTSQATIRATITNAQGIPVPNGRIVKFSTSLGRIVSTTPTQNGVATAVLQSSLVARTQTAYVKVIYQNPAGATPPTLEQTVAITFTAVSDLILLSASPPRLPADGTSQATVTATVVDYNHNPQPGRTVQFATTLGVISPATATTDQNGQAQAVLTSDTRAGIAVVTATMGSLRQQILVHFDPGPPANIALSATPPGSLTANGIDAFTITARVTDANGNPVADGTTVDFSTNLGTLSQASVQTVNGEATVRLTSTQAGTATVTATSGNATGQISVTFLPGPPASVQVSASPASIPANGTSTTTITATVTDAFGNLVEGAEVEFSVPEVDANGDGINDYGLFTNNRTRITARTTAGVASVRLKSGTTATVATVTATVPATGATGQTLVTFTPVRFKIQLTASPAAIQVAIGGQPQTSTITATVTDPETGLPAADGTLVLFSTTAGTIQPQNGGRTTGGVATAQLLSGTIAGVAVVTARVGEASASVEVRFVPGPPANVVVTASPATGIPADGASASTITATVTDANGNPVPGATVDFSATAPAQVQPASTTTDESGRAQTSLTSTQAGTVSVTATAGNVSGTTTVTFVAGPAARITLTASPTSIPADGRSLSAIVATVADANGNPVPTGRVTFTTTHGQFVDPQTNQPIGPAYTADIQNGRALARLQSGDQPVTATITATSGAAKAQITVVFTPIRNLKITLTASPTSIPADGSSTSTIRAIVADATTNAPVADGTLVTFSTNLGTITPSATTSGGVATATLTSSTRAGTATVTASVIGAQATVEVEFTPLPPANVRLTATPTTITANGSDISTLVAEVTDTNGNPVPGVQITFDSSLANTRINGQAPPVTLTTDENGQARANLTGTQAGTTIVTATAGNVQGTVAVTLKPGPPANVQVTASPAQIEANGFSTSTITATVTDAFGNYVEDGTLVSFETTAGTLELVNPIEVDGEKYARTSNGVARATLTSTTVAGTVAVITAIADAKPEVSGFQPGPRGTGQVKFVPGPPAKIELTASPPSIRADGSSTSTITATVKDAAGNLVADGTTVDFATTLGTISPTTVATVNGTAQATLTAGTKAGTATVTATADGASASVAVKFTPGPPAQISVTVEPPAIVADGNSKATVTVTVKDQYGNNVVDGTVVTISTSGGTLEPDQDPATPGAQVPTKGGVAQATLTSSTEPGKYVVSASVGTVAANAIVIFSGEVPANITLGVIPPRTYTPSIWADNNSTLQITAMVTDKYGNPVANGTTVKFSVFLKGTDQADGAIIPAVAQTGITGTNEPGRVQVTLRASSHAGLHTVRADVYDAQGNVVLSGYLDVIFSSSVYRLRFDTLNLAEVPGAGGVSYLSTYRTVPNLIPDKCSRDAGEGYHVYTGDVNCDDHLIKYRAQVLDINLNPVPDGTTVRFYLLEHPGGTSRPSLCPRGETAVIPIRNGWTENVEGGQGPLGWSNYMGGGEGGWDLVAEVNTNVATPGYLRVRHHFIVLAPAGGGGGGGG